MKALLLITGLTSQTADKINTFTWSHEVKLPSFPGSISQNPPSTRLDLEIRLLYSRAVLQADDNSLLHPCKSSKQVCTQARKPSSLWQSLTSSSVAQIDELGKFRFECWNNLNKRIRKLKHWTKWRIRCSTKCRHKLLFGKIESAYILNMHTIIDKDSSDFVDPNLQIYRKAAIFGQNDTKPRKGVSSTMAIDKKKVSGFKVKVY